MPLPARFLQHLRESGYNPRSNRHSNALAEAIVEDLVRDCASLAQQAAAGSVVYQLNFDLRAAAGVVESNVDLVIGSASHAPAVEQAGPIARADPVSVQSPWS